MWLRGKRYLFAMLGLLIHAEFICQLVYARRGRYECEDPNRKIQSRNRLNNRHIENE